MNPQARRLALFVLFVLVIWTLRVVFAEEAVRLLSTSWPRILAAFVLRFCLLLLPALLYLRWVDRAAVLDALRLNRAPLFWIAGTIAICVLWQLGALGLGFDEIGRKPERTIFTAVLTSPFIEEALTRGFALRKAREFTSFAAANVLSSLFFTAIHWPGWIMLEGLDAAALMRMSAWIFFFGLMMGYLLKASGSLWPPILAHAGNNFVSAV